MRFLKLFPVVSPAFILLIASCNTSTNKGHESKVADTSSNNSAAILSQNHTDDTANSIAKTPDTSASAENTNADSMLAKGMSAMFGKNDSGILKNLGGGRNMDSMMKKMKAMMGGKNGNPGDVIGKSLLNFQLGQMSDNNPLKSVATGMQQAQENGTAGPSKTYTAVYVPEQPDNYNISVSGNGNTIMLQYTGGSIANNKKDGLWKNIYISTNKANQWNVYSEGYAESSAINMKVHATSLASINENYNINLNDQYKKYAKQQRSDAGKNESAVQVQKIGNEKMFGYNCIHIKVTYTIKALGQTAHEQDDEWYSEDVPGAKILSPVIFENHSPEVVRKIIETGCSGALVKAITKSSGSSQLVQLSSIIQKDMPDSTYNLPANYLEDKNTALYDIQ
ncbi:MAG: DUF4412 domain-containing protein [Ferruginibacter sp.]